jgi:hypothetical protein
MPLELDQPTQDMSQSTDTPIGAQPGEVDREGGMAKQDLTKIASYAEKLDSRLQDTDQLEAWVQKKIAVAAENLASVYHYLAYEMTVNEYAEYLRKNGLLSEGANHPAVRKLMEAKAKIKELKKAQVDKQAEKKVAEGILSGGERPCTECGGTGMVYEEPKAIPDHVKGKVAKYNTMVKATKAAHKRMDANHNGIPDDEELDELTAVYPGGSTNFSTGEVKGSYNPDASKETPAKESFGSSGDKEMKVGDKKKTRTGELTKTSTGVVHKNTSYHDDGEAEEKSGKGIKSHAKSQSAAEKKEKAPAQKFSPKGAKTWGMKDNEKFDNRDKEVDETFGQGVYEAKPSAGLSKAKKSATVKDAKAGKDIGKPGKGFDKLAKKAGGGEKGEKIAAAAMWKNMKETVAYMAEKKAVKDLPGKQEKLDVAEPKGKIDGKDMAALRAKKETVKESTDFTRMQEQLARLNRSETKTAINESSEVSRLRTLTNLFKD